MRRFLSTVLVLALLIIPFTPAASAKQSVPEEVLASVKSVVRILTKYKDGYVTGSGFIIHSDSI